MPIVGLNSKCYANGSTFPPYKGGIRLYSMRFCPFNQRVLLALSAKNLDFEVININLRTKPDWYLKLNPLGKVPCVQYNDNILLESLIISEWLDEEFPDKGVKLLPKNPLEKAKQKMLFERLSATFMVCHVWTRNKNEENLEKLKKQLVLHEEVLKDDYFAGKEPAYVDYMVWPVLEILGAITAMYPEVKEVLSAQKFPKLMSYMERMKNRSEVKKVARTPEQYVQFSKTSNAGAGDYDIGAE